MLDKLENIYVCDFNDVDDLIKYILEGKEYIINFDFTYIKIYFYNKLHIYINDLKIINCDCTEDKLKSQLKEVTNDTVVVYDMSKNSNNIYTVKTKQNIYVN